MSDHAAIWIDPDRMGGEPCLGGTRLPASHVAHGLADCGSITEYRTWYGLVDGPDRQPGDDKILFAAAWWVFHNPHGWSVSWRRWAAGVVQGRDRSALPPGVKP